MSSIGYQRYTPTDGLELEVLEGAIPGEITVQKRIEAYPLRFRLAATWDINAGALRTKASLKERLLNGSFRYLLSERALEYRTRFPLLGLACVHVWSRWELPPLHPSCGGFGAPGGASGANRWWHPRLGCGLTLGDGSGGPLPLHLLTGGGGLGGAAGVGARLLLRPLTHPFKVSLPAGAGLRLKARCEASIRLPRRLSLWGEERGGGDGEEADEAPAGGGDGGGGLGGTGCGVRLTLRRAALVLDL